MRGCRNKVLIAGLISGNFKDIKHRLLSPQIEEGSQEALGRVTYHHSSPSYISILSTKPRAS